MFQLSSLFTLNFISLSGGIFAPPLGTIGLVFMFALKSKNLVPPFIAYQLYTSWPVHTRTEWSNCISFHVLCFILFGLPLLTILAKERCSLTHCGLNATPELPTYRLGTIWKGQIAFRCEGSQNVAIISIFVSHYHISFH